MRPHGRYSVDSQSPRAKAVCDRCGFEYQLSDLRWQFEWSGPKLQNLRIFVCEGCLDKPQINIKTFVIPPDPVPVQNPRPENYVYDNNPLSGIGADANPFLPQYGNRIGSMTAGGGINAAFDGNTIKPSWLCAASPSSVLTSSYQSYVGINWQGAVSNLAMPSSLYPPIISHSLSSVTITAPPDRGIAGSTAVTFSIQYSPTNTSLYAAWTTIYSGTMVGTAGESLGVTITSTMSNALSQFHRVAFLDNGSDYISAAQVSFSVNEEGFLS